MRLKKIDIFLIIALSGSVLFFLYSKYKKPKSHNLNIAKTEIKWLGDKEMNLGEIAIAKPVSFSNKFINVGSNILWIENEKSSCGCTGFSFSTTELKPNDTCIIEGTISTKFKGRNYVAITFDANTDSIKNKMVINYEGKE